MTEKRERPPIQLGNPSGTVLARLLRNADAKAALRAPTSRERLVVAYYRFSTENQIISVRRQTKTNVRYATQRNLTIEADYIDKAKSAARMSTRPSLQRLIKAIKKGKITDLLIEQYDRLTRDGYDGAELALLFEKYSVQLHNTAEEYIMNKEEQIDAALRAERDRKKIVNLFHSGLDVLVEEGGLPWGGKFGYEKTDLPAFPVKHPKNSLAVVEVFKLLRTLPAADVVVEMERQGFESPAGTLEWNVGHVYEIAHNCLYTGLVAFRRTTQTTDRDGNKSPRVARPEFQYNYNARYMIVSEELYDEVQEALATRNRGAGGPRGKPNVPLIGRVECRCSGAVDQVFNRQVQGGAVRYMCSLGRKCVAPSKSIHADAIEARVMGAVRDRLGTGEDLALFKERMFDRLAAQIEVEARKREDLKRRIVGQELLCQRSLVKSLVKGASSERTANMRLELENGLSEMKDRFDEVDRTILRLQQTEPSGEGLAQRLAQYAERSPFIAMTPDEVDFALAFQRVTPLVTIDRERRFYGQVRLGLHLDLEPWEPGAGSPPERELVDVDLILPHNGPRDAAASKGAEELAASGEYALTDRQWDLLRPHVVFAVSRRAPMHVTLRQIVDALVFQMRTGLTMNALPASMGPYQPLRRHSKTFIFEGNVERMIDILGKDDADWLVGLDGRFLDRWPRRPASVEVKVVRPAGKADPDRWRLNDEQWASSASAIDPRVERPKRATVPRVDARTLIDGTIYCIGTHTPWAKVPSLFGDAKEFHLGVLRLKYTHSWDRLLDIWRDRHPEILESLSIDRMVAQPTLADLRRRRIAEKERGTPRKAYTKTRTTMPGPGRATDETPSASDEKGLA